MFIVQEVPVFKGFTFSFENDFQKLCIEARFQGGELLYSVPQSVNVDFVPSFDGFKPYAGDSLEWVHAFCDLDFQNWGSCDSSASASTGLPHWSLSIRGVPSSPSSSACCNGKQPKASPQVLSRTLSVCMDSYPADFVDFLDLLKDLLGVPVLLLEP